MYHDRMIYIYIMKIQLLQKNISTFMLLDSQIDDFNDS